MTLIIKPPLYLTCIPQCCGLERGNGTRKKRHMSSIPEADVWPKDCDLLRLEISLLTWISVVVKLGVCAQL